MIPKIKGNNYEKASKAFSRQSEIFDEEERENEILKIMRRQVREDALIWLKPGTSILELNCGTGLDAVFFASKGFQVTATDISPGMLNQTRIKVKNIRPAFPVKVEKCGFNEIAEKIFGKYDFVFSNFGGLNCESNLREVFDQLTRVTNPGAIAFLVIMPPISFVELLTIIKGNYKLAFRRLKKKGTIAYVEGMPFTTYYYSRKRIKNLLPDEWEIVKTIGLGSVLPQPHSLRFPKKFPIIFKTLVFLDNILRHAFPFNRCSDHLIFILKKKS